MADHNWAFVTSHGILLIEVARTPDATVRELAARVHLTERQAHRVLADLVEGGYLVRERIGRRNSYKLDETRPMRHPRLQDHRISELLDALAR